MREDGRFHGPVRTNAARDRQVAAVVTVLVVAFVGLAVAKPWVGPAAPTPSVGRAASTVAPPQASLQTTGPQLSSVAPLATIGPRAVAFMTPRPPSSSATWFGLDWRRLAPDDPLSLVTSILRWRGGFTAVGWESRPPATPVWTSADGRRWEPLDFGTSTTFWPGLAVLGVGEVPDGLVALTEAIEFCGEPCPSPFIPPVIAWTSPDGQTWSPHAILPPDWLAKPPGSAPLVAVGRAGVVAASSGPGAHFATSTDGSQWHALPVGAFPSRFVLNDLHGTATGYVAVGQWATSGKVGKAASLWSSDGRRWSASPTFMPTSAFAGAVVGSEADTFAVGGNGMVAVGRGATAARATLWWQSTDGREWHALPTFSPVGQAPCVDEGCGQQPDGEVIGDGERLVAMRGGQDAAAWVSTDGTSWQDVMMTGDLPAADATSARLLPGGVLVSDGLTTWFGEAVTH